MYNSEKVAEKEIEVNYNYLGSQDSDPDAGFPNYVERHLIIEENQFIIVPNGGTGDCLFKAIAQATSDEDDEADHLDIRCQVVDFIVKKMWNKLKDSIEIQHIIGSADLVQLWAEDPIKCYKDYMTQGGTLGSFIELTAAAELFQFSFSSIQEYCKEVKTYRIENFCADLTSPLISRPHYHFLFTGDYESGHWEHLVPLICPLPKENLKDGTYHGVLYIVIDGVQVCIDDWLSDMEEKSKQLTSDRGNGGDSGSEKTESEVDSIRDGDRDHAKVMSNTDGKVSAMKSNPHPQESANLSKDLSNLAIDRVTDNSNNEEYNDDWEETLSSRTTTNSGGGNCIKKLPDPLDQPPVTTTTTPSSPSGRLRSKRKVTSRLFGSSSRRMSQARTIKSASDEKKGCFKTFVSYVSSMMR